MVPNHNILAETDFALARLEHLISKTSRFLAKYGIQKSDRISQSNKSIFLTWSAERLNRTTDAVEKILEIYLTAEKESEHFDFDDSPRLLAIALRELSLVVDPTFFKLIDRDDILEVYDADHIQLFRSFNFFRICNYNLDDVLAHEWFELYQRDETYTDQILNSIRIHMESNVSISTSNIPEHLLKERFSEAQGVFMFKFKHFASVYSGPERKPGFICTLRARPVSGGQRNVDFLNTRSSRS